jgi:hypothetical protein
MEKISTLESRYEFIELNRTFHELSKRIRETDEIDISQVYGVGEHLSWSNLLKEYRVVILSEAGSGKTFEIRNIAHALGAQGKPVFFLRLEHIPQFFEDAFEVGTYEAFENWLASGEEGWIFLDSVDEARLRDPSDFHLAIRVMSRRVSTAKGRTHIVITGRTTAWRPMTDLAHCTACLPYTASETSVRDPQGENERPAKSLQTKTNTKNEDQSVFKIVALDDLTRDQISVFIKARGVENGRCQGSCRIF